MDTRYTEMLKLPDFLNQKKKKTERAKEEKEEEEG